MELKKTPAVKPPLRGGFLKFIASRANGPRNREENLDLKKEGGT